MEQTFGQLPFEEEMREQGLPTPGAHTLVENADQAPPGHSMLKKLASVHHQQLAENRSLFQLLTDHSKILLEQDTATQTKPTNSFGSR